MENFIDARFGLIRVVGDGSYTGTKVQMQNQETKQWEDVPGVQGVNFSLGQMSPHAQLHVHFACVAEEPSIATEVKNLNQ